MLDRHETEHKSLETPDETREFPHGRAEIVQIGGGEIGRLVFEPGWRWSNDVKADRRHRELRGPTFPIPRQRTPGDPHG